VHWIPWRTFRALIKLKVYEHTLDIFLFWYVELAHKVCPRLSVTLCIDSCHSKISSPPLGDHLLPVRPAYSTYSPLRNTSGDKRPSPATRGCAVLSHGDTL
jgi:hypothetical protein